MKLPHRLTLALIALLAFADVSAAIWLRQLWQQRHPRADAAAVVAPAASLRPLALSRPAPGQVPVPR